MFAKVIIFFCLLVVSRSHSPQPLTARLLHGRIAVPGEIPYRVSIQWSIPPFSSSEHFCSGAILNEQWLLTHVKCIKFIEKYNKTRSILVKAGRHDLGIVEESEQTSSIDQVHMYNTNRERQDVGLIKLSKRLQFNSNVTNIKLPRYNSEPTGSLKISGWSGVTNKQLFPNHPTILQTTHVKVLPYADCVEILNETALEQKKDINELVDTAMFCTEPFSDGARSCSGDFGGPITRVDKNNHSELVGLVYWGTIPCQRRQLPSIFIKVSFFVRWINDVVQRSTNTKRNSEYLPSLM